MAKSWKPPVVESSFDDDNEKGKAQVRVGQMKNGKPVAEMKFTESKEKYIFKGKDVPENLSTGWWNVSLTNENTEIFGYFPWHGNFKVKVQSFTPGSGDEDNPAPKEKEYTVKKPGKTFGNKFKVQQFTVLLEIVEPEEFAGVITPYVLSYNFTEADYQGHPVVGFPSTKGRTKQLADFLELAGAWEQGPMKFQDNVLPDLQKRILRADKVFNVVLKDGWVDTVFASFEATEDLDWEESDEVLVSEEDAEEALDRISEDEDDELPWSNEEE